LQFFVGGSGIVILSTGIALVHESSTHPHWAKIAAISLVLTVPLGAASARRLRAIRALGEGEMLARLRDTFLKRSINVRIALFFGIFVLVSIKPALGGALFTILSSIALGLLASFRGFGATTASIEKTAQHANAQRTGT
jgi:ACR3 family arsenite efflux pump ArsB